MVKLVYTGDLKFPANRHVGSSPTTGTIHQTNVETFEEFNAGLFKCLHSQRGSIMYQPWKDPGYEKHARRAQASSRSQQTKRLQDVHVKEALQELKEQNFHQRNKESIV